jgi:hypothetical protein
MKDQIKALLGRDPEVMPISNFKGKSGFIPIYFDYTCRNAATSLIGSTEEETLSNWLAYLKNKEKQHGTNPNDLRPDSTQNKGPLDT